MKAVFPLIFAVVFVLAAGCISGPAGQDDGKVGVVVTIAPQAEFVSRIGGDKVRVTVMVPPGADPHSYEPTPAQMRDVGSADVYAKVGSGVEFELSWLDRIIATNGRMRVVDCSKGIELIAGSGRGEHGGADPHIWLSPKNAETMVWNTYEGLAEADPANSDYYKANAEEYVGELEALDGRIRTGLSNTSGRKFMVFHPAWTYLAREYGLEQIAVEVDGKEPSAQSIANLVDLARKDGIKVVFASPEFSTRSAETIASEIGGSVVLIDPLAGDYLQNMRKASEALIKDLR